MNRPKTSSIRALARGAARLGVTARLGAIGRLRAMAMLGATALLSATALLGPATASAATAETESTAPLEIVTFRAPGSGGWVLGVSASPAGRKGTPPTFGIQTIGPRHEGVDYIGLKAEVGADGSIEARIPGQGRVSVHFDQTSESALSYSGEGGCTVQGRSAILKGVFRGTIRFHGERGYTTIDRRSARGEILFVPGETCPRRKHGGKPPTPPSDGPGAKFFLAGRDLDGGSLEFSAFRLDRGFFGSPPETEFIARFVRERDGILTIASTDVSDEAAADFALAPAKGTPSTVTVDPPAPFTGTAAFALESPTKASWTGDLGVEVPTLGPVELTGPDFWAGACAEECTKTFPPGMKIGFFTASISAGG